MLTKEEEDVLCGFAEEFLGGEDDRCGVTEKYQPALASLKESGLIVRMWTISEAGRKALAESTE